MDHRPTGSTAASLPVESSARLPSVSLHATKSPEPPAWLAAWRPHETVPVSTQEIRRSLTELQLALTPATLAQMASVLEVAVDLHGRPDGWDRKVGLYVELLADLPADLLAIGMRAALRDGKFFPKPAEIRDPIREEFTRRKEAVRRLDVAVLFAARAEKRRFGRIAR